MDFKAEFATHTIFLLFSYRKHQKWPFRASCLSAHRRRLFQIFAFDCINYFMDERRIERSLTPKKKKV